METHKSLPANQEGELYFQGPNIMKGYWQNQEASDDCLDGDWFRTGVCTSISVDISEKNYVL